MINCFSSKSNNSGTYKNDILKLHGGAFSKINPLNQFALVRNWCKRKGTSYGYVCNRQIFVVTFTVYASITQQSVRSKVLHMVVCCCYCCCFFFFFFFLACIFLEVSLINIVCCTTLYFRRFLLLLSLYVSKSLI